MVLYAWLASLSSVDAIDGSLGLGVPYVRADMEGVRAGIQKR
ncbi:MAG: hypothetical protein JWP38_1959 [Herbaspirillum sp.]|nr:hypothetical protein [Herbaspirillum sp.]